MKAVAFPAQVAGGPLLSESLLTHAG
jgi:hypothetical protein